MAIGDYHPVDTGDSDDYYYLDTGMYDVERYGTVYLLDAERPAILDTGIGTNYEFILEALEGIGIDPAEVEAIVPTHVHLDHAGGAGYLAEACPNADIHVHRIGAPHLVDPSRLVDGTKRAVEDQWEYYAEPRPIDEERIVELEDGDTIDLGDRTLEAYHAPGHAPHQLIYYDPDSEVLTAGDAAGIWVPALEEVRQTSPPSNFDLEQCLEDVDTIRELDPETILFGHFGPVAADDDLLVEYKDVLAGWVDEVETKRAELEDDEAVIEHFEDETEMAEVWGDRKARAEERLNVRGVLTYLDHRDEE